MHPDGDVFPNNTRCKTIFNIDKIKAELGYNPTLLAKWLQATLNWFFRGYEGDSIGYERRQEELRIIEELKTEMEHV